MVLVAWSRKDVVAKEVILLMERLVDVYNVQSFWWGMLNLWGIPVPFFNSLMETAMVIDTKMNLINLMYIIRKKLRHCYVIWFVESLSRVVIFLEFLLTGWAIHGTICTHCKRFGLSRRRISVHDHWNQRRTVIFLICYITLN